MYNIFIKKITLTEKKIYEEQEKKKYEKNNYKKKIK